MISIRSTCASAICIACFVGAASAQVFLQLDGFGIGNAGVHVTTPGGPLADAANIHNMFFPQTGNDQASVAYANRGSGLARITSTSSNDGGNLRAYAEADGFGNSACEPSGCGNGAGSGGVTTRINFRVSAECVLLLRANMTASTQIDFDSESSASGSAMCNVTVASAGGTVFGSQISNSANSITRRFDPETSVGRLFPGIDYALTVNADGQGASAGRNASGYGYSFIDVTARLRPPACPAITAPANVIHCSALAGSPATFSAAISGQAPLTIHWQAFLGGVWTNLSDGAVAGVGTVSSSGTDTLTISGPGIVPNLFRATASNACGSAASMPAALSICASDFNCDSAVDFFDYLDFIDALASGDMSADFNHDSIVDLFDYLDFVDVFSTGC